MRILCKAPGTIHPKREYRGGYLELAVSVERERVPGDAVPGNAVPRDAVPGEVIPGDAVPGQGVPGEQRPENAAEQRIVPLQGRTKKERVQRAGETVRGPQSAIGTGYGSRAKERADQEPTQEHRVGRCI